MTTTSAVNRSTLVGFIVGSLSTMLVVTFLSKKKRRKTEHRPSSRSKHGLPSDLRDEQLSRHTLYFGEEGMAKLKSAKIVVIGLGGVGSHTAHMLARAGVSHLRLIDFDQVTLSSLNRHACATLEDVGSPKATCLRLFLEKICPDPKLLRIEDIVQMYTARDGPQLLSGENWDLVLDCIDDTPTKAALLAYCIQNDIRVVSCMGAGGKSDVTRLHISDLRTATRDPLASKMRQCLKRTIPDGDVSYLDDMDKVTVVFSSEKPVVKLADFTEQQNADGVHNYGAIDGMRIRILPVLGTMPAVMGQAIAAFALCELGEKPFSPVTGERIGRNVRHKLYQQLKQRERKIMDQVLAEAGDINDVENGRLVNGKWIGPVQVDTDDMEYILETWRNRCAVTGDRLGAVLSVVRWDLSRPSYCDNLVLLGKRALAKFDSEGKASIPDDICTKIEKRLSTCEIDIYS